MNKSAAAAIALAVPLALAACSSRGATAPTQSSSATSPAAATVTPSPTSTKTTPPKPKVKVAPPKINYNKVNQSSTSLRPALGTALTDEPASYAAGCQVRPGSTDILTRCQYGDPKGKKLVVMIGDSKNNQWFTSLDRIARAEGWKLYVHTKSSCAYSTKGVAPDCAKYVKKMHKRLEYVDPYAVILSHGSSNPAITKSEAASLKKVRAAGSKVVIIDDNIPPKVDVMEKQCLVPNAGSNYFKRCTYKFADGGGSPSLRAVDKKIGGADAFVEVDRWICPTKSTGKCPSVIDGLQVFRAGSHLTDTFASKFTSTIWSTMAKGEVAQKYRKS